MKVRSMRGEEVDMGLLLAKNEGAVALGNASMNARGDKIDKGGKIVKTREQIAAEHYAAPQKTVRQVALRDISKEVFSTPQEVVEELTKATNASKPAPTGGKRKTVDRD